jgi:hypothetical protein
MFAECQLRRLNRANELLHHYQTILPPTTINEKHAEQDAKTTAKPELWQSEKRQLIWSVCLPVLNTGGSAGIGSAELPSLS